MLVCVRACVRVCVCVCVCSATSAMCLIHSGLGLTYLLLNIYNLQKKKE